MTTRTDRRQIAIAGCGPAGMLCAAACARRGLDVVVIGPSPEAVWTNRYAAWVDELAPVGLADLLDPVWPNALVRLDGRRELRLERAYGCVDNAAMAAWARREVAEAGGAIVDDTVEVVKHDPDGATLTTASGRMIACRAFVDATGHRSRFVRRQPGRPTAFQTAYGVVVEAEGGALPDASAAILMDYSGPTGGDLSPPTFLYAMALGGGRYFFEETVLLARPPLPHAALADRLEARLDRMGIEAGPPTATERCTIPMDAPLPVMPQRTIGFGAAAAFVHPATGFMIAHAATLATRLADALYDGIGGGGEVAAGAIAERAWAAIWPDQQQRAHTLFSLGANVVCRMDGQEIRDFFEAFFALDTADWAGYLSRTHDVRRLAAVMLAIFSRCPPPLRRALAAEFVRHPLRSASALLNPLAAFRRPPTADT